MFRHPTLLSTLDLLKTETEPFALVHDFRVVKYSTLDISLPYMEWGRIVSKRQIERVAFVVDPGRMGRVGLAVINGMLRLSPVQPARVFATLSEAQAWSTGTELPAPSPVGSG